MTGKVARWLLFGIPLAFLWGSVGAAALSFRTFYIPSGSMEPTLVPGDRFIVLRRGPLCPVLALERGDIVVARTERGDLAVRRVVGLAGDRVRLDDQGLEVNGERATGPILRTLEKNFHGRRVSYDVAEERIGQTSAWMVYAVSPGDWGEYFETMVPEGHVFSLGDNRASSNDDRFQGPTPVDAIVGSALRVTFSLAEDPGPFWRNLRVHPGPSCASS